MYGLVTQFPKSYKFTLGSMILTLVWQSLDAVIAANLLPNNKKLPQIRESLTAFEQYTLRVKMAHELKLINNKKYAYLMSLHEEIEKMLYGWLAWAKRA